MRPTRRDSALVAAGAVVSGVGGFGFTWLLARATGPSGAGVVLTVTTWFTLLLTLGKFGMDTTLVREGGRIRAGGSGAGTHQLLRWTLWPVVAVVAVAGLVVAVAAQPIGQWILADSPVSLTPLVIAGGLLLPFAVYTVVQLAYLRGLGSMAAYVSIEQLLKPGARLLGAAALMVAGVTGALAFGWVWFLPVLVGAVLSVVVAARPRPDTEVATAAPAVDDGVERARVWRYAGPRAASQAVDIVNTSFGTVVLGIMASAADTGAFATALRVVFAGQLVFQSVRLLVAPSFAALLAKDRIDDAQEVFAAGTALIVALAWPAFLLCLILPELVLGLFGSGFESAAGVLQVLSVSGLLLAVVGNQGSVVLMSGRSGAALVAITAGLVVNVVVTLLLLQVWGPVAAAAGWTAAVLVEGLWLARTMAGEGFRPLPVDALSMAAKIALTVGLPLVAVRVLWPVAPWAAVLMVIGGVVGLVLWVLPNARVQFHLLTMGEARE